MARFTFKLALQTLMAVLLSWSVELVTEQFGLDEVGHSHAYAVTIQIIKPAIITLAAALLGAIIHFKWEGMRKSSLWVWVTPVCVLIFCVASSIWGTGLKGISDEYFFWAHPGRDEPPLGLYLFTYPAIGAVSYSLGVLIARQITRRHLSHA